MADPLTDTLRITVLQSPGHLVGPKERLDWLSRHLDGFAGEKPDVVVLPELFQCGYNIGDDVNTWAEHRDGPFAQAVARLAQSHGSSLIYGYAEQAGKRLYNSAQAIGWNGTTLGHHRKLLLPPGYEGDHFSPGRDCVLFDLGGFRVAMLVCYDVEFPENLRHVAMAGADLVVVPTALAAKWSVVSEKLVPTRAFENGVFVAYANHCGEENGLSYHGGSCIVGPDGADLARAGAAAGAICAVLDWGEVAKAQARLPYHRDRAFLPWVNES